MLGWGLGFDLMNNVDLRVGFGLTGVWGGLLLWGCGCFDCLLLFYDFGYVTCVGGLLLNCLCLSLALL